jgi:hypothetical protein
MGVHTKRRGWLCCAAFIRGTLAVRSRIHGFGLKDFLAFSRRLGDAADTPEGTYYGCLRSGQRLRLGEGGIQIDVTAHPAGIMLSEAIEYRG